MPATMYRDLKIGTMDTAGTLPVLNTCDIFPVSGSHSCFFWERESENLIRSFLQSTTSLAASLINYVGRHLRGSVHRSWQQYLQSHGTHLLLRSEDRTQHLSDDHYTSLGNLSQSRHTPDFQSSYGYLGTTI